MVDILEKQINNYLYLEFELSNRCNYSAIHPRCPNNPLADPMFLASDKVYETIDLFSYYKWSGEIYFSIYSEPLIDPRFFKFLEYANVKLPDASIVFLSNGWGLDEHIFKEAIDIGLCRAVLSAYGDHEFERLSNLKNIFSDFVVDVLPYPLGNASLDDRATVYNDTYNFAGKPCYIPYICFFLNSSGNAMLCHLDYLDKYSFGNVYERSIQDIITSEDRIRICDSLRNGDRSCVPMCTSCKHSDNCCPASVLNGSHIIN